MIQIQREMAVFCYSGSTASISSQYHIVLHKSICYAESQCCNSYFGQVPCLVLKSCTSAPPPLFLKVISELLSCYFRKATDFFMLISIINDNDNHDFVSWYIWLFSIFSTNLFLRLTSVMLHGRLYLYVCIWETKLSYARTMSVRIFV